MGIANIDGDDEQVGGDPLFLILIALFILFMIITIGTLGYRVFGKVAWIDAFHNASMVLTSTSLVAPIKRYTGKIFSAFYNLLTGIFVLVIIGVIIRRSLVESGISTSGTTVALEPNSNNCCCGNCNSCNSSSDSTSDSSDVFSSY